jgi:hypothetical protein
MIRRYARMLKEMIDATMPGVEWWEFWNPGSGIRGAAIMALVFFCTFVLLNTGVK